MSAIDPPIPVPAPVVPPVPALVPPPVPVAAPRGITKEEAARLWFKEIVTAALTLAVLVALFVTYHHLSQLPDMTYTDATAREMNTGNVEKIATALFGIFAAFVGYYAGRVPAEKAAADSFAVANQAQQAAAVSQSQAATSQAGANELARKLEQELVWSDRANELLAQTVPLLDRERAKDVVSTDADDFAPRLLASEVARHLRRRNNA
jgi:hypothetical protein